MSDPGIATAVFQLTPLTPTSYAGWLSFTPPATVTAEFELWCWHQPGVGHVDGPKLHSGLTYFVLWMHEANAGTVRASILAIITAAKEYFGCEVAIEDKGIYRPGRSRRLEP